MIVCMRGKWGAFENGRPTMGVAKWGIHYFNYSTWMHDSRLCLGILQDSMTERDYENFITTDK